MNQLEFRKEISDLFIFEVMQKIRADYDEKDMPKAWFVQLLPDTMMTRYRRHGIFGWCETDKAEKEYSHSIDWHMRVYQLSGTDLTKLVGAIEYRLSEILNGNIKFLMTQEKYQEVMKRHESHMKQRCEL